MGLQHQEEGLLLNLPWKFTFIGMSPKNSMLDMCLPSLILGSLDTLLCHALLFCSHGHRPAACFPCRLALCRLSCSSISSQAKGCKLLKKA
eukprot:scaffold117884_cov14-Tisochrysis_lutea.AAC.1